MLRSQAAGLTAERRQPEDGVGEGGAEEPDLKRGAVADGAQEGYDHPPLRDRLERREARHGERRLGDAPLQHAKAVHALR